MNTELNRRECVRKFRFAVANAHGIGAGLGGNELMMYVIEHGLPSRAERERIQAERDAREQDTTLSSSPG